jgi:Glycosyltransferase family 87
MTAAAIAASAVAMHWLREADPPAAGTSTSRPHLVLLLGLVPLVRFGINDLGHGQVNWLLALLVAGALLLTQRGRDVAGGACLGAALVVKPTAWPLFVWFAAERRGRVLAAACAAALVAYVPVLLRYGPAGTLEQTLAWLEHMPRFADHEAFASGNASLSSTIGRWLAGSLDASTGVEQRVLLQLDHDAVRPWARALATAAVFAALAWLLVRTRRGAGAAGGAGRARALAPAALLPLAALASPVTWKAHLVGLLPVLLVLARDLAEGDARDRRAWATWLAVVLLFTLPSRGVLDVGWLDVAGCTTAGLVVLFVWLGRRSVAPAALAS